MQQQPPQIFIQHQQRLSQSLHPVKREELHQRQLRKEQHQHRQCEEDQQLDDDEGRNMTNILFFVKAKVCAFCAVSRENFRFSIPAFTDTAESEGRQMKQC
jgi:hypothetical protein